MEVRKYLVFLILILILPVTTTNVTANPASVNIEAHESVITADQGLQFFATVKDSSGNVLDENITWFASSGNIDSNGFFTPGSAGQVTITASSSGLNDTTYLEVTEGWPYDIVRFFNTTDFSVDDTIHLNAT